jgi:hypothetical protein
VLGIPEHLIKYPTVMVPEGLIAFWEAGSTSLSLGPFALSVERGRDRGIPDLES